MGHDCWLTGSILEHIAFLGTYWQIVLGNGLLFLRVIRAKAFLCGKVNCLLFSGSHPRHLPLQDWQQLMLSLNELPDILRFELLTGNGDVIENGDIRALDDLR